ncbi:hypothetical protein ACIHFD_46485 [Nonomuraea sp. NPDC051941]|uniref:hypothetical protein n=1 Tax=Nonomuraea sp. NPDC051941 TaxID=3364373 RepID=UPI0037CB1B6F
MSMAPAATKAVSGAMTKMSTETGVSSVSRPPVSRYCALALMPCRATAPPVAAAGRSASPAPRAGGFGGSGSPGGVGVRIAVRRSVIMAVTSGGSQRVTASGPSSLSRTSSSQGGSASASASTTSAV